MASRTAAQIIPGAYRAMLAGLESDELRQARTESNPYKREALRLAFDAGWFAVTHRVRLGAGWTSPLLSRPARAAWVRGFNARVSFESPQPQE